MGTWRYGIAIGALAVLGACLNSMGGGSNAAKPAAAAGSNPVRPAAMAAQPKVAPNMVKQVQSKLRDDGYYKKGAVDGVWGAGTESAVRSFQRDHNLGSSGQLDIPTLQALDVTNASATNNGTNNSGANYARPDYTRPDYTRPDYTSPTDNGVSQPPTVNPNAPSGSVPPNR